MSMRISQPIPMKILGTSDRDLTKFKGALSTVEPMSMYTRSKHDGAMGRLSGFQSTPPFPFQADDHIYSTKWQKALYTDMLVMFVFK